MPLLAVHKTVAGTGAPGSNLIYSITVQNTGNQGAANVTVSEAVPGLTTYVAAGSSPAWVCAGTAAGSSCTAAIAALPAGASTVLTYVAAIASPLPANASVITNQACAAAPGLPSACGVTGIPTAGQPSLHLAKSYGGGAVLPGAVLPFTLTVSNSGNQDVGAALLTETVPALSSFDAGASDVRWLCAGVAAGSSCTLDLGSLPAGTSQAVAFAVRAAAALPAAAVIANAACVTGRDLENEAAGARTALGTALRQLRRGARPAQVAALQACGSVETPPALAIDTTLAAAVVGHASPALPGDRIHYILTVPNGTGATLTTLLAAASLDANTALVAGSVTTSQGAVTTGNGAGDTTVAVALGDLAASGTATVEWDVTVHASLPPGLTQVAAQVETTGGNIPPDESGPPPPPSTPGPTETPVTAGALPPPQAIPTLGEWGLGAMIVLLGGVAIVLGRRRSPGPCPGTRPDAGASS
jgi:large repetitive protein